MLIDLQTFNATKVNMLFFILIVAVTAQELGNYPNFNAQNVRNAIKRGATFRWLMGYIHASVISCIESTTGGNLYVSRESPNKCTMTLRNKFTLSDLVDVHMELTGRQFEITYQVVVTPGYTIDQIVAKNLHPSALTISW